MKALSGVLLAVTVSFVSSQLIGGGFFDNFGGRSDSEFFEGLEGFQTAGSSVDGAQRASGFKNTGVNALDQEEVALNVGQEGYKKEQVEAKDLFKDQLLFDNYLQAQETKGKEAFADFDIHNDVVAADSLNVQIISDNKLAHSDRLKGGAASQHRVGARLFDKTALGAEDEGLHQVGAAQDVKYIDNVAAQGARRDGVAAVDTAEELRETRVRGEEGVQQGIASERGVFDNFGSFGSFFDRIGRKK